MNNSDNIKNEMILRNKKAMNESKSSNEHSSISGKVIMIPDVYSVIIDIGFDILKIGDEVRVYEPLAEITNHDGKVIGYYKFIKERLTVVETSRGYSVCRKVEKRRDAFSLVLSAKVSNEFENLKIDVNDEDNKNLTPKNTKISLGDPVEY